MLYWNVWNTKKDLLILFMLFSMALSCENGVLNCSVGHSCSNTTVAIENSENCNILCSGYHSCDSLQIITTPGNSQIIGTMNIMCTGNRSCHNIDIERPKVNWFCTNEDSCQGIGLNCTNECSIKCSGLDSCIAGEYYCMPLAFCNATATRQTDAHFHCKSLTNCKSTNWTWEDQPPTLPPTPPPIVLPPTTTSAPEISTTQPETTFTVGPETSTAGPETSTSEPEPSTSEPPSSSTSTTTKSDASSSNSTWSIDNPIFIIIIVAAAVVLILIIVAILLIYKLICLNKTMELDLYSRKKDGTNTSPKIASTSHTTTIGETTTATATTTNTNTNTTSGKNIIIAKSTATAQPKNTTVELIKANAKEESSEEHSEEEKAEEYVTPGGPDLNKLDLEESEED